MFICRANGQGGKVFLENRPQEVANNLARMDDGEELNLEYWKIVDGEDAVTLEAVTLKTAARVAPVTREVVVIEAGGEDVGSVEREV